IELPEALVTQDYALMIIKAYADGASSDVVYLDNISIADPLQCDAAIELSAPERVKKGQEVNLKIKVSNLGIDKIENAVLKVSMNDKVIYQSNIKQSLAMLQEVVVPISYTTTILDPSDCHAIKAELTVNNDLQTDNNIALANILLEKANVLPPTNLTSNADKPGCIELSWKQPETVPELITDNFEGYEAWGTDFGKWSTYDADKGFAMQVSVQVKYPHQGEQFAFMNWKPNDYFNGNRELAPHSGEKAAVALYQLDSKGNMVAADNWLISQLLTGKEQTISFWVNNVQGNKNTTETFEVLTSSTDNQPASFKKLDSYEQATGTWKEISVKLPAGTRYFAIRHTTPAKQVFVFMVDDITFEASNGPASYNIYRGDTLLARTIQTSFIDENLTPGSANSYKVTAVYPDGAESEPLSITVTTDIRTLVGNAEQPFNVYTIDGKLVYKGLHKLTSLPKGTYIINGKTIVVR
ncbi:choice-of-anchor J domain-containing protein, partial [Prevotella aurantiaca]